MFEEKYAHIDQFNKTKKQLLIHHLISTGRDPYFKIQEDFFKHGDH